MDELPSYVARLLAAQRLSSSELGPRGRACLRPLFDGGALETEPAGRGEIVRVTKPAVLLAWIRQNFPAYEARWGTPETTSRARAVALRRNSKATNAGAGASVLHLRALAPHDRVMLNAAELPVADLTARHGLAACLIDARSTLTCEGPTALIENLECFLRAEALLPATGATLFLNSAGRISDQLIGCLARSRFTRGPLLHLPDYDPVGLSDYLRLRTALGANVTLFAPEDIAARFVALGNRKLITEKPRNRALLEQLAGTAWPCRTSARIFDLIKETGSGLEQESLFLKTRA